MQVSSSNFWFSSWFALAKVLSTEHYNDGVILRHSWVMLWQQTLMQRGCWELFVVVVFVGNWYTIQSLNPRETVQDVELTLWTILMTTSVQTMFVEIRRVSRWLREVHVEPIFRKLTSCKLFLDYWSVDRYTSHESFSGTLSPCAHITSWLKVLQRAHSLHPHAIHDVTCLSVRWLFLVLTFSPSLSLALLLDSDRKSVQELKLELFLLSEGKLIILQQAMSNSDEINSYFKNIYQKRVWIFV